MQLTTVPSDNWIDLATKSTAIVLKLSILLSPFINLKD